MHIYYVIYSVSHKNTHLLAHIAHSHLNSFTGNPVLCEDSMRSVINAMEATNNTKIHAGETMCDAEIPTTTTVSTTTTTTTTQAPLTTTTTEFSTTSTTSTTSETPATTVAEEVTETITLELPQPVETSNQIPVHEKALEEKLPPNVEEKIVIEEKIIPVFSGAGDKTDNTNVAEEMMAAKENIEEKRIQEDAKDSKEAEDKTPNRIPTGEQVTNRAAGKKTIAKLSPLLSALGPDNVAYVVDNTTEMEFESISVIKN